MAIPLKTRRFARGIAQGVVVVAVGAYLLDLATLHWPGRASQARVRVVEVYALGLKSGKTEFDYAGSEDRACVRTAFPHGGEPPCWYLERHRTRIICC